MPSIPAAPVTCLQCGAVPARSTVQVCRRCGLRFGEAPPDFARLASCPVCYRDTDADGRLTSLASRGHRLDINAHIAEHDRFPVGDDEWLESLRVNDRIRVGRWSAPFDLVRRYLVTGVMDAGRNRLELHSAVLTAMAQVGRWGPGASVAGDQADWREARSAVEALMERYHRGRLERVG